MGTEIERKFLVNDTGFLADREGSNLCQAYVSHEPDATVRVRIQGGQAWLTIKGRNAGARRQEFEYPIPVEDARAILEEVCPRGRIEKTRYRIEVGAHVWEVDVFHGDNRGLVLAEIELESEDEPFERPGWLGDEVTHDVRYYNSSLSSKPFRSW